MSHRFIAVFDEALCSVDPVEVSTCTRAGSENNPHRHFNVMQIEISDDFEIVSAAVSAGMHVKEITKIQEELSKAGVKSYIPNTKKARIRDTDEDYNRVRLKKETSGGEFHFVDIVSDRGMFIKEIAKFPPSLEGYQDAYRKMLAVASEYNIPYDDMVVAAL